MHLNVHCLPSDLNVNVQGVDTFTALNTGITYVYIVDELGNQIVDENGAELVDSITPVNTQIATILVNVLPLDLNVNTE